MEYKGRIVKSVSGHDKNRFYLIVAVSNDCVWIADGKNRKLEKPKRKNMKHVSVTNHVIAEIPQSNQALRRLLVPFNREGGL